MEETEPDFPIRSVMGRADHWPDRRRLGAGPDLAFCAAEPNQSCRVSSPLVFEWGPMSYRRLSSECLLLAGPTLDQANKAILLSMALAWLKLAEFTDRATILAPKSPRA
jgi:hypothetical protein